MTYKKFIESYKNADKAKKSALIKKHMVNDYLPYQKKIAEAKRIVNFSCYEKIDDKKVYMQNSPLAYMLFSICIIQDYTDITWDTEKESVDVFNEFDKSGALDEIIASIPKKEYETFSAVLNMVRDDEYENFRSIVGFLDTKADAVNILLKELTDLLEKNQIK
jgi:hypothetical protein